MEVDQQISDSVSDMKVSAYSITDDMLLDPQKESKYFADFGLAGEDSENIDILMILAKLMNNSERFDEMLVVLKRVIKYSKGEFSVEKLNNVAACFKNLLNNPRNCLKGVYNKVETPGKLVLMFKEKLQQQFISICTDALRVGEYILERIDPQSTELLLMGHKMMADYYRYWAEMLIGTEMEFKEIMELEEVKNADKHYGICQQISSGLVAMHYMRIGIALNHSVFLYEILKQPQRALNMADKALREAQDFLNGLEENEEKMYTNAVAAWRLLHENVKNWNDSKKLVENSEDDEDQDQGNLEQLTKDADEDEDADADADADAPQEKNEEDTSDKIAVDDVQAE